MYSVPFPPTHKLVFEEYKSLSMKIRIVCCSLNLNTSPCQFVLSPALICILCLMSSMSPTPSPCSAECPPLLPVLPSGSQRSWLRTFTPSPGRRALPSWSAGPQVGQGAASSSWGSGSTCPCSWGRGRLPSFCVTGSASAGVRWSPDPTEVGLLRWGFLWPEDL